MAKLVRRTPKESVEKFLMDTEDGRELSQRCRDYFDHRQWTAEEVQKLRARKQAAIVVNRIKPKVEGLLGLYELRKSDPKGFPRTRKHEEAAKVVTDALRYVADNTEFQMTRLDVAEDFFVEGYGGVFINVRPKNDEIEIGIDQIPWDRIYFDSSSRRKDFKDAMYMGFLIWMDIHDVPELLPNTKIDINKLRQQTIHVDSLETTADRPRWASKEGNDQERVRIATHFEKIKGIWRMTIFSGDYTIVKEQDSPFFDEDGLPMNPMELVSANVDRDNNRYGEVAGFLSQQDEINHRRSKFLYQNSVRQTFGNDNAIQDVDQAKRALREPEGHLKINGDAQFGKDFGIIPITEMSNAQFSLYQDAKSEMDRASFSAPLGGETNDRDLSGVALEKLQQGSSLELNRQYALLSSFEKRVYDQIWFRIKQFWTEEKFIRVTDDQDSLRWVGFNSEITVQKMLEEAINDQSSTLTSRQQNQQTLQFLIQTENPKLQEVVEMRNEVSELDMDIIIDQSFDVVNIQQEQFALLSQFAQGADIDIIELIELSQLRGKDELIQKIERRRQQAANPEAQEMAKQGQIAAIQGEVAKTNRTVAETQNINMDSITKQIENVIVANAPPDPQPQVSV